MTKKSKSKKSTSLNPFHPPVPQTPNQSVSYKTAKMPPVHPDMAKLAMSTRKPAAVWQPPAAFSKASNTVQGAPSIVEMARALKNDPQLMYEFVYNNIEHQIGMGLAKGALGTLLDGVGNSFDLSSLLAALLREAGFDAYYEVGQIQLTFAQVSDWLGITDTNIATAVTLIANAGVPVSLVGTAPDQEILMTHCWLKVNIGTALSPEWVVMDPSFKTYTTKSAIDLGTAMGYSASSFLSDARSGYTIDGSGNWVKDLNRTNVRNNLTSLSMALADWIKTNNPGARTDDIIGGRQIVPVTLPVTFPSDLPYQAVGDTPDEFTGDFSTAYKVSVRFVYYGIDETLTSDQLCGHRLTLFFVWNGSGWDPTLALDGVTVATGTAVGTLFNYYLQVTVTHNAYPTTGSDQTFYLFTEGPNIPGSNFAKISYLIGSSFGPSGKGLFDYHNDRQMKAEFANGSVGPYEVAEPLLGERMAAQWASFASQATMVSDILSTMSGTDFTNHHLVGLVAYRLNNSNRYFSGFDIQGWVRSLTSIDGSSSDTAAAGIVDGMHRYAIEMLAIQQQTMPVTGTTVGSQGVSTTRLIDVASLNGEKLFKGTSSNWSTVTPQLTGYGSGNLNFIDTTYLMNGLDVLLPQNYGTPFGTPWTLRGWSIIDPAGSAAGTILGAYAGGLCFGWWPARRRRKKRKCVDDFSVNPQDGSLQLTPPPDITIGSGGEPYLIPIFRPFDSGEAGEGPGPMGNGWDFNWDGEAEKGPQAPYSDGYLALGTESPINAVASITQIFVALDILSDTSLPVDKLVIAHLTDQWWVDNLTNNIVTIRMPGEDDLVFTKLPDGSFQAPQDNANTLTGTFSFTMTTPQQVQYVFDGGISGKEKLYSITYPNGVSTVVNYSSGKITSVDNGMGRALNFTYTGDQVTSIDDGNGRSVSYSYDVDGNLTQFTDLMGQAHTYEYSSPGLMTKYFKPQNPTDAVIENTYDSLDRVQSQVDIMGHNHTYYIAGSRSEIVDPVGNSEVRYYDSNDNEVRIIDALGNVTTSEFDGLGRLVKQVEPEGNYTTWVYDLNNNILTEARVPKPGSTLPTIYNYKTYNLAWNKPDAFTDGRLLTTYFTYDALTGDLIKIERMPIGLDTPTVEMTYNSRGQVLTKTDETGIVTSYIYDTGTEVLLSVVQDYGSSPHLNLTTNFGYDAVGNLTSVEDPLGRTTYFVFDDLRRLTTREETSPFNHQTLFEYDQNSNSTLVKRETGDIGNPWQEYAFTYSLSDKKLTAEQPGGATSYWFYDSADRMYKTEDAEGREYIYTFDELNRVIEVLDPTAVTSEIRSYSANGKLVSIEDARGNVTSYTLDGFDRVVETAYPDSTSERVEFYDEDDNIWTFRNRAGDLIYRSYDVLNRIDSKTTGFITTTYTYDLAGRLLTAEKPVITGDPSTGVFEQQWDSAGRFVKEIYPDAKEVAFELDANGNVTKITYPDGYYVDRLYDELNRLTDIKLNGDTASAASFAYDPLSRRTGLALSSGSTVSYDWQLNNDLATLSNNMGGAPLVQAYTYNAVHQMTEQTFNDDRYSWHPTAAGTVSYDTAGDTNQYPEVDSVPFTYNANGCLTSDGVASYAYDDENHMIAAYAAGLTFSYDPFHRQSAKFGGAVNTRYIYSGWQRLAEYDSDMDTLLNRFVYGTRLDEPLIEVSAAGTLKFLHANHQGSIMATTDDTGAVVDWNSYSPFGENFTVYGTTVGFTGQRFDVESNLYYYKRRYYEPKLGRFLQPDPIGYQIEAACGCSCAGGCGDDAQYSLLNLYDYAMNSPLQFSDPYGLAPCPQAEKEYEECLRKCLEMEKELLGMEDKLGEGLGAGIMSKKLAYGKSGSTGGAPSKMAGFPTWLAKIYYGSEPFGEGPALAPTLAKPLSWSNQAAVVIGRRLSMIALLTTVSNSIGAGIMYAWCAKDCEDELKKNCCK